MPAILYQLPVNGHRMGVITYHCQETACYVSCLTYQCMVTILEVMCAVYQQINLYCIFCNGVIMRLWFLVFLCRVQVWIGVDRNILSVLQAMCAKYDPAIMPANSVSDAKYMLICLTAYLLYGSLLYAFPKIHLLDSIMFCAVVPSTERKWRISVTTQNQWPYHRRTS